MAPERKRPFYLFLALLGALALGTTGARSGWATMMVYREPIDVSLLAQGVNDTADRAAIESTTLAYVHALDAAKARGWPLAVATLLVGAALVVFSMRALGGTAGARAALVQLVAAQAGVNVVAYWLLRDVLAAEVGVRVARGSAVGWARVVEPLSLVLSLLSSALVVVALTRRRSREFFEASAAALEER
jgi:hypothetical protein